jgi:hypothetical protein
MFCRLRSIFPGNSGLKEPTRSRFNIAPTQDVAAVRVNPASEKRELALLHWGLIPFWAEDPKIGYSTINARADSVATILPKAEVVPTSEELGIGQIVWSPIAQGVLTGKYKPGEAPPAVSRATDDEGKVFVQRFLNDQTLQAVQNLQPIANDVGLSMAQLAVAWVLQNDNVASAIVGATRPEQINDNVKASGVTLDDDVMSAIDEALSDVVADDPAFTDRFAPKERP